MPGLDEPDEESSASSVPNALVLFNPGIMGRPMPAGLSRRLKECKHKMTPYRNIRPGLPPSIMFFGSEARLLAWASQFAEGQPMRAADLGQRWPRVL